MTKQLDCFVFLGSTYTYLTVNRVQTIADREGIALRWRPFSARTLMIEQNNRPFVGKPVKLTYMWRDVERRARRYGIPFAEIPNYPNDPDELANRVATVAATEGWCLDFAKAAYAAWFIEDKDPGANSSLNGILNKLQRDASDVIARANGQEIRDRYVSETETARSLGIFGSPTFVCGTEIFWGDDRFEDAIDWCKGA